MFRHGHREEEVKMKESRALHDCPRTGRKYRASVILNCMPQRARQLLRLWCGTLSLKSTPFSPVIEILTYDDLVSGNFNHERAIARLTSTFGVLVLLLASIGLYGVTAYSVARRTGEIGIRIALGAVRARVVTMVLCDALVLIAAGVALRIPSELAVGR